MDSSSPAAEKERPGQEEGGGEVADGSWAAEVHRSDENRRRGITNVVGGGLNRLRWRPSGQGRDQGPQSSSSSDRISLTNIQSIRNVAHQMDKSHQDVTRSGHGRATYMNQKVKRRRAGQVAPPERRRTFGLPGTSITSLEENFRHLGSIIGVEDDGLRSSLATALLINLLSIGYLSLPFAFAQAGALLSALGFALIIFQAFVAAQYVLESCARAHFLADAVERMAENVPLREAATRALVELREERGVSSESGGGPSSKLPRLSTSSENNDKFVDDETSEPLKLIERFKAEIPELCKMFLGRKRTLFFVANICCDLYGLTWSYAAIFANGFLEMVELPLRGGGYKIFILIFAVICVPLSCAQLDDSIMLQLLFLGGRCAMFVLMIGTVAGSWASGTSHFDDYVGPSNPSVPLFGFRSLYLLLQISVFSSSYQFAVPGIADASKKKETMLRVCASADAYVFVTVLICSLVLSTYFGAGNIQSSSNLNWKTYHGGSGEIVVGDDGAVTRTGVAIWAKAISGYITVFPAIDSIAVFPLCTISLGEIIMNAWYGGEAASSKDWKKRTAFRLVGCCPQLIGALFVSDLSIISNYAGLFTTFGYYVCPSLLYIYSGRVLRELGVSPVTSYKTLFSRDWIAWTIAASQTAMAVYVVISSVHAQITGG